MDFTTANYAARGSGPFHGSFGLLLGVAIYVYTAYCLYTIAKKTNTENAWFAWIPILNFIIMLRIARKSLWWIIGLLIPFVNIIVSIMVWMKIAEERRRPSWWGVLMIVPVVNWILMYLLAFKEAPNAVAQVTQVPPPPSAPPAPPAV
jgi:hypothetical protein